MASPELHKAIDRATHDRLQRAVNSVCKTSTDARALFEGALLAVPKKSSTSKQSAGRKRPRFVLCQNCEEEFDILQNVEDSCKYHPGTLEVDYEGDSWAYHDEGCAGPIDTDEMRKEYPDGFKWYCCNQTGEVSGCETSSHEEGV